MLESLKQFQLHRLADLASLTGIIGQGDSERRLYTAIWAILIIQLLLVLMTNSGRRIIFTTVDTVLAVVLVLILLLAILGLPFVALYIGARGSLLMARSLSDNFPALGLVLRPLLALLGQQQHHPHQPATEGAAAAAAAAAAVQS